ncbi:hypothetical protein HMPREF9151_01464 [Hoylesella saccharolytica F0055]|uniref:Uncharacterized protein n=1 Tax=Hoylesella saccharolytica F0055 TaxID=1127699 RepID=L1N995_9BACT|nr:hypothetical protein HMPREF9151_01464 [Hoylesella saccharolytica F0055]
MGHSESEKLKKVQEWVTLNVKSCLEEAAGARQGGCDGYPPDCRILPTRIPEG